MSGSVPLDGAGAVSPSVAGRTRAHARSRPSRRRRAGDAAGAGRWRWRRGLERGVRRARIRRPGLSAFCPASSAIGCCRRSPVRFDVAVLTDCPNPGRTEGLIDQAKAAASVVVNIDHHPDNRRYGHVNWIDTERRGHRRDGLPAAGRPGSAAHARPSPPTSTRRSTPTRARSATRTSRPGRSGSPPSWCRRGPSRRWCPSALYERRRHRRAALARRDAGARRGERRRAGGVAGAAGRRGAGDVHRVRGARELSALDRLGARGLPAARAWAARSR